LNESLGALLAHGESLLAMDDLETLSRLLPSLEAAAVLATPVEIARARLVVDRWTTAAGERRRVIRQALATRQERNDALRTYGAVATA